jgi:hypothetical protein
MRALAAIWLLAMSASVVAHQPVMDMAPRWSDGYGFQLRTEYFGSGTLKHEGESVENPLGVKRYVNSNWLEGIYTFNRAVRATLKIPHIQEKRTKDIGGVGVRQSNSGFGDIVVGLPLKRYYNQGALTQNWGFTPSLRIPTGNSDGDFPNSDGSWDLGLSLSYSSETPRFYQLYDLYYWKQGQGDHGMEAGDVFGLDINVGIHPWHSNESDSGIFVMWDVSARHESAPNSRVLTTASGGDLLQSGAVLVLYRDNLMARLEFKFLAYERVDGTSASRGDEFSLAIGLTF